MKLLIEPIDTGFTESLPLYEIIWD